MLLKSTLIRIIEAQKANLDRQSKGLEREALKTIPDVTSHAIIITGIRRCGKSTLLKQLLDEKYLGALYLNFEDPRLYDFENNDLARLDEIIAESNNNVLLFDEIQVISAWERYVRQKLDEGYQLFITGSNASLLSSELGTKLTGRHISKELFPFSYKEFMRYRKKEASADSLLDYLGEGGIPEYVKTRTDDILSQLFEDILLRDIAVRWGVRDIRTLQRLALYLVSNVGKLISGNKLRILFEIGATSTVMEHLSHMEAAYLFHFIPRFSYSLRKQMVNPRKVYAADTGLVSINTASFSDDRGRKFENLVFLHLRRQYTGIYYFHEKGECDFIVHEKGIAPEAVQVCFELNRDNLDRELNGLFEAMDSLKIKQGTIVTLKQTDRFEKNGLFANVVPACKFLESKLQNT